MEIPKKIQEAINNNNLVVFAGSGLSTKFDLPDWITLVEDVILQIDKEQYNPCIALLKDRKSVFSPIEILEKLKGEHTDIRKYIRDKFHIIEGDFTLHENIIELSGQIITTNFDNAFEQASRNKIIPSIHTSTFNISEINKSNVPYIFKIHGSYHEPDSCILFKDDYAKIYSKETAAKQKLESIFSEKTILFIGFSFNDADINLIFNSLDSAFGNHNRHFILTKEADHFRTYKFLETIEIQNFDEIDLFIEKCLKQKKNQNENRLRSVMIKTDQNLSVIEPKTPMSIAQDLLKNKTKELDPDSNKQDLLDTINLGKAIVNEIQQDANKLVSKIKDSEHLKKLYVEVQFDEILYCDELDFITEKMIIEKLRYQTKYPWYERSLIVSALSLSIIRKWDANKVNYLLDFIRCKEDFVWKRALVGLVLGLNNNKNLKDPYLVDILKQLKSDPEIQNALIEIYSVLNDKLQNENVSKFSEITNFFRYYDFFDKPQHWFIPFYENNPHLMEKVKNESLRPLLVNTVSFVLNAFKYSFCLNYHEYTSTQILKAIETLEKGEKEISKLFNQINSNKMDHLKKTEEITSYCREFYFFYENFPKQQKTNSLEENNINFSLNVNDLVLTELIKIKIEGDSLYESNNYAEAKDKFVNFLQYVPNNEDSLNKLGCCYQVENNYLKALDYHLLAYNLEKNNSWNLRSIGCCYYQLSDYDNCIQYMLASLEIEDENNFALSYLGSAYCETKDFEKSIVYCEKYKALNPENGDNLLQLGWSLFLTGNIIQARHQFFLSIKYSEHFAAYMNLGHCELILGDVLKAEDYYQKSFALCADKKIFFKELDDDFKHLKPHKISKIFYSEIINKLKQ